MKLSEPSVEASYNHFYVCADDQGTPDYSRSFTGQNNGLCGAGERRSLFVITGIGFGSISIRVEAADSRPQLDPAWEDVVEVSLHTASGRVALVGPESGPTARLTLAPGTHRLRYSTKGLDAAHRGEAGATGTYEMVFWPAEWQEDVIVQSTSAFAIAKHESVRNRR